MSEDVNGKKKLILKNKNAVSKVRHFRMQYSIQPHVGALTLSLTFFFLLNYVYFCVSAGTYAGQKEMPDLELELQAAHRHLTWVLRLTCIL